MPLIEEMQSSGRWLFRRRSYVPLVMVTLLAIGVAEFRYPFGSHALDTGWEFICLGLSLAGLAARAATVGFAPRHTSGRNTSKQVADTLNTTGMYSIVRNPLYLGNYLVGLGPALFLREWWIPIIYTLVFMLYYERIVFAEEGFLREKFAQAYMDWAAATPAFVPRLRQWKRPAISFNIRKVCRQEHQTLLLIIARILRPGKRRRLPPVPTAVRGYDVEYHLRGRGGHVCGNAGHPPLYDDFERQGAAGIKPHGGRLRLPSALPAPIIAASSN